METKPRSRVVLLGASNLTLAFRLVVARLRAALPAPLGILAAIGHGRSYGRTSRMLARELPGITECGLWRALDRTPEDETDGATCALLTDFGNDIVYGADVDAIAGWIETALERLARHRARCALVRLPLRTFERVSPLRFWMARGILYPSHRIAFARVRERARALDARIVELARAHGAALVEQREDWYGVDPVHIRRRRRDAAWREILAPLEACGRAQPARALERAALGRLLPERRRFLGRDEVHAQPAAELLDGTTISVY
ncbi:MAG TPA: hypothetical protein VGR31_13805 [Planctomycetota bacterium]|nr:hypothetical protein [Planctomycetota bacterium]